MRTFGGRYRISCDAKSTNGGAYYFKPTLSASWKGMIGKTMPWCNVLHKRTSQCSKFHPDGCWPKSSSETRLLVPDFRKARRDEVYEAAKTGSTWLEVNSTRSEPNASKPKSLTTKPQGRPPENGTTSPNTADDVYPDGSKLVNYISVVENQLTNWSARVLQNTVILQYMYYTR